MKMIPPEKLVRTGILMLLLLIPMPDSSTSGQELSPAQKIQEELVPGLHREKDRFTLNLKDAKLREVLLLLTRDAGYSLVLEPGIDGTISALDMKAVTIEEVLDSILPGMGLEYQLSGTLLRVRRPGMQTRLFYLNYLAADRTGKREMRMRSRSQMGGSGGGSGGMGMQGGMDSSSGGGGGGSGSVGGSETEGESKITTTNSASVWRDLRLGLETILFSGASGSRGESNTVQGEERGPEGAALRDEAGRRLLLNPLAGLVMIHAETSLIEEAGRFLEAVEGSVQRQVLIEAKIIEVTLNKDYQLGINWSAVLNPRHLPAFYPLSWG